MPARIRFDDFCKTRVDKPLKLEKLSIEHFARFGKRLTGRLIERSHLGCASVLLLGEIARQPCERLRQAALHVEDGLLNLLALPSHARQNRLDHLVLLVAAHALRRLDFEKAHFKHKPYQRHGNKGAKPGENQKKRFGRHVGIRKSCGNHHPFGTLS